MTFLSEKHRQKHFWFVVDVGLSEKAKTRGSKLMAVLMKNGTVIKRQ